MPPPEKIKPNLYDIFPMPYIKLCGQKESSPSKEEMKEKNAINLRIIRYASSSSIEKPAASNVSSMTSNVNDEDEEENLLFLSIKTKKNVDSEKENFIEVSRHLSLHLNACRFCRDGIIDYI